MSIAQLVMDRPISKNWWGEVLKWVKDLTSTRIIIYNNNSTNVGGNLSVGSGVSCSFSTLDGHTVTVVKGIVVGFT